MNQAVLALKSLREAIGSEWRHKSLSSSSVTLVNIDERALTVHLTETPSYPKEWPIRSFLRNFKPSLPKDKVPSWYERLLADRLL